MVQTVAASPFLFLWDRPQDDEETMMVLSLLVEGMVDRAPSERERPRCELVGIWASPGAVRKANESPEARADEQLSKHRSELPAHLNAAGLLPACCHVSRM